jgi:hypothetical protein
MHPGIPRGKILHVPRPQPHRDARRAADRLLCDDAQAFAGILLQPLDAQHHGLAGYIAGREPAQQPAQPLGVHRNHDRLRTRRSSEVVRQRNALRQRKVLVGALLLKAFQIRRAFAPPQRHVKPAPVQIPR